MIAARALALCALLLASLCAHAQAYPNRLVKIVVPYPPAGTIDLLARGLAPELSALWGQPVVVENIPGAGSLVGAERAANAPPDGYTLFMTVNPTVVGNRFLFKKLPYDPDKSFAPVSMIAQSGQFIVVHPSVPANTLKELIELARREPGKIAYSSFGNGSQPQLLFETIAKREGVQFLHVPYKGIAHAITAIVAGEVQLNVASPALTGALVKSGKLKVLALGARTRTKAYPDVPTVAEAGYPYALASIWLGIFAPGGTPAALVERIRRDVSTIANRPDFIDRQITGRSFDLVAGTPAEFAAAIRAEVEITAEMVKAAGIQPE